VLFAFLIVLAFNLCLRFLPDLLRRIKGRRNLDTKPYSMRKKLMASIACFAVEIMLFVLASFYLVYPIAMHEIEYAFDNGACLLRAVEELRLDSPDKLTVENLPMPLFDQCHYRGLLAANNYDPSLYDAQLNELWVRTIPEYGYSPPVAVDVAKLLKEPAPVQPFRSYQYPKLFKKIITASGIVSWKNIDPEYMEYLSVPDASFLQSLSLLFSKQDATFVLPLVVRIDWEDEEFEEVYLANFAYVLAVGQEAVERTVFEDDEQLVYFVYTNKVDVFTYVFSANRLGLNNWVGFALIFILINLLIFVFIESLIAGKMERTRLNEHNELLMSVAHELKTPMSVVLLRSEKVQMQPLPPQALSQLEGLDTEVKKMNARILDILDLSKLESNKFRLSKSAFYLDALIDDTVDAYAPQMDDKEIALHVDATHSTKIVADPYRIRLALGNFLSNAIKHTPNGGRIEIRLAKVRRKNVRVSVFNSGSHVPEQELQKIWGSFYKVSDGGDNAQKGTGLGLSIVKRIIALHGGRCGAVNRPDGVLFWFETPVGKIR
jgi:signal transduction histidine kinase